MAGESIRISALGRDIKVGDLYNYFHGEILTSNDQVPEACLHTQPTSETEHKFFFQQPDEFKGCMLGINTHFNENIKEGHIDENELWFAKYLEEGTAKDDVAQVTVVFKLARRIETLDQEFLKSKLVNYQKNSGGRATHLVEKVVYGTEIICLMQRPIDKTCETKLAIEERIYLAAKNFFAQAIGPNSTDCDIPVELIKLSCIIFSSHVAGNELEGKFQLSASWLRNTINFEIKKIWQPVEVVLRPIPSQLEVRLLSEKNNDIRKAMGRNEVLLNWIEKESSTLSNHSTTINKQVPPLEKIVCHFVDILAHLKKEIENSCEKYFTENCNPEQFLRKIKSISELLVDMMDWLICRRGEMEIITLFLKDIELIMLDVEEIKTLSKSGQKQSKVFVLRVDSIHDPLMERIQKFIGNSESGAKLPVFQIVSAEKRRMEQVRKLLRKFADDAELSGTDDQATARHYIGLVPFSSSWNDGETINIDYSTGLCPANQTGNDQQDGSKNADQSSSLYPKLPESDSELTEQQWTNEGAKSFPRAEEHKTPQEFEEVGNSVEKNNCAKVALESDAFRPDSNADATARTASEELPPSENTNNANSVSNNNSKDKKKKLAITSRSNQIDKDPLNEIDRRGKHDTPSLVDDAEKHMTVVERIHQIWKDEDVSDTEIAVKPRNVSSRIELEGRSSISKGNNNKSSGTVRQSRTASKDEEDDGDNFVLVNGQYPSGLRMAEFFAQESSGYSQLIKEGEEGPNVHLLSVRENSVNRHFRRFETKRPNAHANTTSLNNREHKVIILMGATGCGKSTLINGMVNYMLGVRWDDPFRFKIIREDVTSAHENQAFSQTSSVTAYTIHHHEGMAVPYSVTIIDTPGYGDTRGVKRDKEITRQIHMFLTQLEYRINEIHAACFVAASGDSRLTATQGYILDSVLSIFGKDFKENIRLLVTFADNADPPVVEACRVGHFPVTSPSGGIIYSKFNSSVLYASNRRKGKEEICFDELFWDMGQENFEKFFKMLEGMGGKDLKSTREVIQRRQQLEKSLRKIENELEECLATIENAELFRMKLREYGHKMETNKNFKTEKTVTRLIKIDCDDGYIAYNCRQCKRTCDGPLKKKNKPRKGNCNKPPCSCPHYEHEFETFEWRPKVTTTTKTLLNMKAEYELNCDEKMNTEQLIQKCSEDLNMAKAKVFSLLDQVGDSVRSLESTALRSNTLSPADYLSLMRSRVAEEQKPGYMTRLETLAELQRSLAPPVQGTLHQSSSYTGGGIGYSRVSSATTTRSDETGGGGSWSHGRGNSSTYDSCKTVGSHRQSHPPYGNTNNRQSTTTFENHGQATRYMNDHFSSREDNYDSCSFI